LSPISAILLLLLLTFCLLFILLVEWSVDIYFR
jgi:hypothetical protein